MYTRTVIIALLVAFALNTWAETGSDKLDIKKLEDKYWSSKDDDFSVVQNRAFQKAGRYFVSVHGGIPLNDPYSTGTVTGLSVGYFKSEFLGFEFSYYKANYKNNIAVDEFNDFSGTVPNHNNFLNSMTLSAEYIPLYGKMSFMDKRIVYFDIGAAVGLGQTTYESVVDTGNLSAKSTHYSLDLVQHLFFTEHFAFKVNYRNTFTNEKRYRYKINSNESESARPLSDKMINDTMFLFGVTYFH